MTAPKPASASPSRRLKIMNVSWTEERVEKLLDAWRGGISPTQIAILLDTTAGAVKGKLNRMGIFQRDLRTTRIGSIIKPTTKQFTKRKLTPSATTLKSMEKSAGVSILDLEPHHCRWPLGDPKSPTFAFCGERKQFASAYCEKHHAISRRPAVPENNWKMVA